MQIKDLYLDAVDYNMEPLILLLDFLIYEKKVLSMEDDESKLTFYFQEKFRNRMNEHLNLYKKQLEGEVNALKASS
ncbi:MAG: hypothetical protein LPK00_10240 [Bacillaceae bacterium]|nr:hypothetical protein [Bacillaceae bacterium]